MISISPILCGWWNMKSAKHNGRLVEDRILRILKYKMSALSYYVYVCLTPLDILGNLGGSYTRSTAFSGTFTLVRLLSVLDLLQCSFTLSTTEFWFLWSLLFDILKTQTNDSTLNLVRASSAFLQIGFRETLLVKTAPCLGPDEFRWLFTLERQRLSFGRSEEDGLSIATDEKLSSSRPDPVFGKGAQFSCEIEKKYVSITNNPCMHISMRWNNKPFLWQVCNCFIETQGTTWKT